MDQEFTLKSESRKKTASAILFLALILGFIFVSIQKLKAQSYVQVPTTGGLTSPTYPAINFSYGPFSGMNVRSAMLYPASELSSISTPLSVTSLGFKLANSTSGSTAGNFIIYIIPTTDNNYNLSANWSSIEQHPDIVEVYNGSFVSFSPITGHINFNLASPFSLLPGQGFYLITDWESTMQTTMSASYDCNSSLTNSYHLGFYNDPLDHLSHPPTTLPHSSNYRHVLRLGYAGNATGISENTSGNLTSVYPNPAHEVLHIEPGKFGVSEVRATLREITGKTLKTVELTGNRNQINLNGFAPGIYSLHLTSGSETLVKRIVIE